MEYLFQALINVRDDRLDLYIRDANIVERWPRKSKPNKDDNPSQDDDDFTDVWKLDEELARVALKAINDFTDAWKLDEELARVALKAINERLA